jgi:hypothetical protein
MSFCLEFKYSGSYFVPELNDTETSLNGSAICEKAIRLVEDPYVLYVGIKYRCSTYCIEQLQYVHRT